MSANQRNKTYRLAVYVVGAILSAATVILCFMNLDIYLGLEKASAVEQTRPNILVIMADDLSVGELNTALSQGWMSNLKSYIIDHGTTFTQSFVSDSLCCPSRSTFLTGQYPHNHGVLDNVLPLGGVTKFKDDATLATCLQKAGYRTGHVGKYLNRYGEDLVKDNPTDDPTYVPPGWTHWQATVGETTYSVYNYIINDNGQLIQYGDEPSDYQTDVLAQRSVNFINESEKISDTKPFFLVITPLAPHQEHDRGHYKMNLGFQDTIRPAPRHKGTASQIPLPQAPSFNEQDVSSKPAWLKNNVPLLSSEHIDSLQKVYRDKLESLRAVDDLIGTVVSALKENGELDNTVLIFTSDNGFLFGEHRIRTKTFVYEEAIRVPLFIRTPEFSEPQSTEHFVLNNDLAPTIADLADATPSFTMDGRSLIPLLKNTRLPRWRKRVLIEHWISGQFKLMPTYFAVRTNSADRETPNLAYVEYEGGDQEFYDLASDPYQLHSLHKQEGRRKQQVNILQNWLAKLRECKGKSCQMLEDN